MHRNLRLRTLVVMFFSMFLLGSAHAQYGGGIQGNVTDSTGAVVGGAKVAITNQGTGKTYDATASELGFYSVTNLAPGTYTVTAQAPGFKKNVVTDAVVTESVL